MHYILPVIFMLLSIEVRGQTHWLKLTGGLIINRSEIQFLEADERFSQKNYQIGYKFGLTYDHFFQVQDRNSLGIRTGLQLAKKRYCVQLTTIQAYQEINNSDAELKVNVGVFPNYLVVELPIALLYKKSVGGNFNFLSFAAGCSLDWMKGSLMATNSHLELFNPQGIPQQFQIRTTDDFAFDSQLGYSTFLSTSYNFLLTNRRYGEIGISYHLSPVKLDTLHITHSINGEIFETTSQPKRLDYLQFFISYSLSRKKD